MQPPFPAGQEPVGARSFSCQSVNSAQGLNELEQLWKQTACWSFCLQLCGCCVASWSWGRAGGSTWVFVPAGAQSAAPWDTPVVRSSARGSHPHPVPCQIPCMGPSALCSARGTPGEPEQAAALLLGQHLSIGPRHRRRPPVASVGGRGGLGAAARRERGRCREHCGSSAVAAGSGWLGNRHCNRLRCQSKMSSN